MKIIATNKKARFNYRVIDELEVGIVLSGTEVKSLRCNSASIVESFITEKREELWLHNLHIPKYGPANRLNHQQARKRKLLLHKRQIKKMIGLIKSKGLAVIPLSMYSNDKGLIKLKIATATGKKKFDKREDIKKRDWERRKSKLF